GPIAGRYCFPMPTDVANADSLAGGLSDVLGLPAWMALCAAATFHAFLLVNLFGVIPLVAIWAERKVSGRLQDRLGPTRTGGAFGWLQGLADGIKLIQKEDLVPASADKWLFRMAPFLAGISAFGAFMFVPFGRDWAAVSGDIGLFAMLAILSLGIMGIVLAGYSSGSKWSLFGGIREAAQMVSYEIPLALCAVIPVLAAGSLDLAVIGEVQREWGVLSWLVLHDPFTFVAAVIYFVVATAECKRAPFDLAEAESELVGGFHTEYASMRWSLFMLAEYAHMFLVSAVAAILFFGAWYTGIGPLDGFINGLRETGPGFGFESFSLGTYVANLIGMAVVIGKASVGVLVQIWVRWSLPRLRIDQVMTTCLKYLVPICCVLLLGAALWPLMLISTLGRPTLLPNGPIVPFSPGGEGARRADEGDPAAAGVSAATRSFMRSPEIRGRGYSTEHRRGPLTPALSPGGEGVSG
ncbi:MAG: complex I subunit 1 family protein, partial [Planctomycetota bacterium]